MTTKSVMNVGYPVTVQVWTQKEAKANQYLLCFGEVGMRQMSFWQINIRDYRHRVSSASQANADLSQRNKTSFESSVVLKKCNASSIRVSHVTQITRALRNILYEKSTVSCAPSWQGRKCPASESSFRKPKSWHATCLDW